MPEFGDVAVHLGRGTLVSSNDHPAIVLLLGKEPGAEPHHLANL